MNFSELLKPYPKPKSDRFMPLNDLINLAFSTETEELIQLILRNIAMPKDYEYSLACQ